MSELRKDPITGRWVIVTAGHTRRPSDFTPPPEPPDNPDLCPFCEGRESIAGRELLVARSHGTQANGPGWQLRVVANREPMLRVEARVGVPGETVFQAIEGLGAHEVIIETPRHGETLSTMTDDDVWRVLWAWRERIRDLKRDFRFRQFVVLKNHGTLAGARIQHSHSQLIALPVAPPLLEQELQGAARYLEHTGACVFCDIIQYEEEADRRVIAADDRSVALAPYASRAPFETWVLPRQHGAAFEDSADDVLGAVAGRLHDVLQRIDNTLLSPPFYLVLHSAPVGEEGSASFHWHIEVVPRLAPVGGLEWGSGLAVNPVAPEEAADVLRNTRKLS